MREVDAEAALQDEAGDALLCLGVGVSDQPELAPPHEPHTGRVVAVHRGGTGAQGVDVLRGEEGDAQDPSRDGRAAVAGLGGQQGGSRWGVP
jgi:hypothetical protein